jgi:hypothetical protein
MTIEEALVKARDERWPGNYQIPSRPVGTLSLRDLTVSEHEAIFLNARTLVHEAAGWSCRVPDDVVIA